MADKMTQQGNTVYLYSFDYYNPYGFGIAGLLFPFKGLNFFYFFKHTNIFACIRKLFIGATHCSEIPYLFNRGIIANFRPNANDLEIMHRFSTYFTNFAKYG